MTTQTIHVDMPRAFTMEPTKLRTLYTMGNSKHKSIDNDRVLRGRPVDRRPNRLSHQLQPQRDDRPKAADRNGRPPKSLPPSKEQKVPNIDARIVTSAPSKEQESHGTPVPKINTLVNKSENSTSIKTNASPSTASKSNEETKPSARESTKPQESNKSPAPEGNKIPVKDATTGSKSVDKKVVEGANRSLEKRADKSEKVEKKQEKPNTGLNEGGSREDTKTRESRKKLPADDHGPVEPVITNASKPNKKSISVAQDRPTETNSGKNVEEEERKRKEREVEFKKEIERQMDNSPQKRALSERSAKTDKSWSTIKTKTSDGKPSVPAIKSKTSYDISPRADLSDRPKRREVTIVDPKSSDRYDTDDDDDEPFAHEYEYRHSKDYREKTFNEMTDEEKITYFRDHLKMKPDQIRELTFHPKVTESKTIHRAYTGIETGAWKALRLKSGRRPKSRKVYSSKKITTVAPHQRKTYIHSRLQGAVYRHINNVYGTSPREGREKRFFEKLSKLQMDDMQYRYEQLAEKERRKVDAMLRQRDQLKRVRKKFEDDAWRRFMTQYVTSKVVEAEYKDRQEYGLPNNLGHERNRTYHGPSPRDVKMVNARTRHKANVKKFGNIFKYSVGPEHKSGGRQPMFEGFDTVYIDTEDEHDMEQPVTVQGNVRRKKQDVAALMREAQRILEQSDNDDTDIEDSPRYEPRRRTHTQLQRSHARRRIRDHPDDKSTVTSTTKTGSTRSKASKQTPKTMREMLEKRQQATNRYRASGFDTMKENLLKDSIKLNKNENLSKMTTKNLAQKEELPDNTIDTEKGFASSAGINTGTPSSSPVAAKSENIVQQSVKTVTTVTTKTTVNREPDTISTWTSQGGQTNGYLDEAETQVGIDTARDKERQVQLPSSQPSRATSRTSVSPGKTAFPDRKPAQRAPSRQSVQVNSGATKDLPPVRPPSRTSVISKDPQTIESPVKTKTFTTQRRESKTSFVQEQSRSKSKPVASPTSVAERNQDPTFITEAGNDTQRTNTDTDPAGKVQKRPLSREQMDKSVRASYDNLHAPSSRRNSDVSVQKQLYKKPANILVSRNNVNGSQESVTQNAKQPDKHSTNKQGTLMNSQVSPTAQQNATDDNKQSSVSPVTKVEKASERTRLMNNAGSTQPNVTRSVNVQEHIETTDVVKTLSNASSTKAKQQPSKKSDKNVQMENTDLFSTKKAIYHDKNKEHTTSKPRTKMDTSKGKKQPTRPSRSRSPSKADSHDVVMKREEYEDKGHVRRRGSKRSTSRDASPRGRKRSTSRSRRGRKRSVSKERKKTPPTKSRFPDIVKKDGKWEITAKSTTVTEEETERIITPKPSNKTTENQWKSLVEKYIRQPSPKIGKADDRSLLDSNLDDDDDDDMDIFKRASKRYNLDDDDDDSLV